MVKRSILLTSILLILAAGCAERGKLVVSLTAGQESALSGETVTFSVAVEGEKSFTTTWSLYDNDGVLVEEQTTEEPGFSCQFTETGTYSVDVIAVAGSDYGMARTPYEVMANFVLPPWELSQKSVMGGELTTIDLSALNDPAIATLDLRLVSSETGTTAFLRKNASGQVAVDTSVIKPGAYRAVVTVRDEFGNEATVEDELIILDPDNPILMQFTASDNDYNYPGSIYVSGTIDTPNPLLDLQLIRICYYGKEEGISPLAEPKYNGGVDYFERGRALVSREEVYSINDSASPLVYNEAEGTFSFTDPMPYYGKNGAIEEVGFEWDYAKFDREAWKYIKRRKHFDLKKSMQVEYRLKAISAKGTVLSGMDKGHPFLRKLELAALFNWTKEVALNRVWKLQVGRFAWDKTATWLNTQKGDGQYSGYVQFVKKGMGGYGELINYSDWEGWNINSLKKIEISVDLTPNQQRILNFSAAVTTPLYAGTIEYKEFGVRDYTLQWGYYTVDGTLETVDADGVGVSGEIIITRDGIDGNETVSREELMTIMPIYNRDAWSPGPGYNYDPSDFDGVLFHGTADYEVPTEMSQGPPTWTKINYFYPPTGSDDYTARHPLDSKFGNWSHRETDWVMNYEYQ